MFDFVVVAAPWFIQQTLAHFPCANDGQPVLAAEKGSSSKKALFSCQCPAGFFGTFCEYRTNSDDLKVETDQQKEHFSSLVDKFGVLFPRHSESVSAVGTDRHVTDWHWQEAIVNLLVCVFFLLILPSLVVYTVRFLYLCLKRCHRRNRTPQTTRPAMVPTPPPQYCASSESNFRFRPNPNGRHRSESPGITEVTVQLGCCSRLRESAKNDTNTPLDGSDRRETAAILAGPWPICPGDSELFPLGYQTQLTDLGITEVTVQLPASICRPLHGTRSLNLRPTTSLTLNEFHGLLLAMQREMAAQQRADCANRSQLAPPAAVFELSPVVPPVGPPPNYESALLSSRFT